MRVLVGTAPVGILPVHQRYYHHHYYCSCL